MRAHLQALYSHLRLATVISVSETDGSEVALMHANARIRELEELLNESRETVEILFLLGLYNQLDDERPFALACQLLRACCMVSDSALVKYAVELFINNVSSSRGNTRQFAWIATDVNYEATCLMLQELLPRADTITLDEIFRAVFSLQFPVPTRALLNCASQLAATKPRIKQLLDQYCDGQAASLPPVRSSDHEPDLPIRAGTIGVAPSSAALALMMTGRSQRHNDALQALGRVGAATGHPAAINFVASNCSQPHTVLQFSASVPGPYHDSLAKALAPRLTEASEISEPASSNTSSGCCVVM